MTATIPDPNPKPTPTASPLPDGRALDGDRVARLLRSRLRRLRRLAPFDPAGPLDRRASAAASASGPAALRVAGAGDEGRDVRLLLRATFGFNLADLERVQQVGREAWIEQQLHPEEIDDHGLEEALEEALPSIALSTPERLRRYVDRPEESVVELLLATVLRALYSPRQLFERTVAMWSDHFHVHLFDDPAVWLKPTDDRDVVRRHALGPFRELLHASATSPAMLVYLTNHTNVAGHPNENYARELMELHTLGVDGGFTEGDVKEVARCFTGWRVHGPGSGPARIGTFRFSADDHDFGAKTVLGRPLPAGRGMEEGEEVLEMLADHPSTARFLAGKFLTFFWGDAPPAERVEALAETFTTSGGDPRAVLRAVLSDDSVAAAPAKLKRPWHLFTSMSRALFAEVRNLEAFFGALDAAGHLPFQWAPPNGFPQTAGYWAGLLLPRWNYATLAVAAPEPGLGVDLSWLDPEATPDTVVAAFDRLLLGGRMTATTREVLRDALTGLPPGTDPRAAQRHALALALSSPDFQEC